ncbi:uncharacterized protein LOC114263920 [Camellia sinensis]|uniref:uncharacterized protein LOC114263920 n=1 Tax=Camellia sinensis TaxID=4442 RepID=UPI00103595F2|nr:uncharacterized protein LOC114263920 [Camellia sinensis]
MKDPILVVGMKFPNPQVFKEYLREFNVVHGYDIRYIRNESARIIVVCRHGCTWRIHASPFGGTTTFQIKTLEGKHTCERHYNNKQANSKYLGKNFVDEVRDDPSINIASFKKKVRREIMVDASRFQIYRAKRKTMKIIARDLAEQYHRIRGYEATVISKNPTSHISITTNPEKTEPTFEIMYFRLDAQKDGFLTGCRPIIGLDVALVEIECKASYSWFLEELMSDIESVEEMGWTFISDRRKGLVKTFAELYPTADHIYCLRHMYSNFKTKYSGCVLKDLFWKAASTGNVHEFNYWMKKIEKADPKTGNRKTAVE